MSPNQYILRKKQSGSMLVMALFVIIVLSLLGLAMIQILSDSNRSVGYEVYGARAFNAANSGADRALAQLLGPGAAGTCDDVTPASYDMPDIKAFHGCKITSSSCKQFDIAQTGYTHFRVTSTARCSAGDFITERRVAVEARVK